MYLKLLNYANFLNLSIQKSKSTQSEHIKTFLAVYMSKITNSKLRPFESQSTPDDQI
jgi:TPP-dependent 2-oxoacid decarboxylase